MAVLKLSDIQDVMTTTLDDYGPPSFRQVAQRLTRYEIFSRWFREEKIYISSGVGISRRLMTSHDVDNLHTGPFSEDVIEDSDHMASLRIDWVYIKKPWKFNYEELQANQGEALLTDLVEPKRANCMLNIAHDIEAKGWGAPSGSSDNLVPYGVPFWIVKNASSTGFNGSYPTGFTSMAGIDLTEHSNFKNYTDGYSDVSEDDLVFKMSQARQEMDFVSPEEVGGDGDVISSSYRVYVNNATRLRMKKFARSTNDNLGYDLSYEAGGGVSFNGNKVINVPALNTDTSDPVYMICHDVFAPVVRQDDFLRESEVIRTSYNHDTYVVWMDMAYNYLCEDRRRNGVISKAA